MPKLRATKDPTRLPAPTPVPPGSLWSDLDHWVQTALVGAPLVVLVVLGAIFVAPEIAIVVAVAVVAYAVARGLLEYF